jgi:hypothetical protein
VRREIPLLPLVLVTLAVLAVAVLARFPPDTWNEGPGPTPQESRTGVVDLVRATAALLPEEHWWPRNGPVSVYPCALRRGERGVQYDFDLHIRRMSEEDAGLPAAPAREAAAELVADHWRELGMTVTIAGNRGRVPTVYGSGGPVLRADFATDGPDETYSVGAVSACARGDADELLAEEDAQRAAGIVLPGDEGIVGPSDPPDPESSPPRPRAEAGRERGLDRRWRPGAPSHRT